MIHFGLTGTVENFAIVFEKTAQIAKELTKQFPSDGTMSLTVEKVINVILYHAKCYALAKKDSPKSLFKFDIKGLQVVKNDTCVFVANLGKKILEDLLYVNKTVDQIKQFISSELEKLLTGKVTFEDLAIWQKISSIERYKNPPAQVLLNERLWKKYGKKFVSGQSIGYVYIDVDDLENKKPKIHKIEQLDVAKEKNLPIDYHWYILKSIMPQIGLIISPIISENIFEPFIEKARITQSKNKFNIF